MHLVLRTVGMRLHFDIRSCQLQVTMTLKVFDMSGRPPDRTNNLADRPSEGVNNRGSIGQPHVKAYKVA